MIKLIYTYSKSHKKNVKATKIYIWRRNTLDCPRRAYMCKSKWGDLDSCGCCLVTSCYRRREDNDTNHNYDGDSIVAVRTTIGMVMTIAGAMTTTAGTVTTTSAVCYDSRRHDDRRQQVKWRHQLLWRRRRRRRQAKWRHQSLWQRSTHCNISCFADYKSNRAMKFLLREWRVFRMSRSRSNQQVF